MHIKIIYHNVLYCSVLLLHVSSSQICNRGKVHIFKYLSRIEQLGGSEAALVSQVYIHIPVYWYFIEKLNDDNYFDAQF